MRNDLPSIDFTAIKNQIADGHIDQVIPVLIQFIEGADTKMTTEIYLAAARFRKLEQEKRRGEISAGDYKTEFSSVTLSLLEIINALSKLDEAFFKKQPSKEETRAKIDQLRQEFAETDAMKSIVSQLRMKIHIARKIAEKLILWPAMIYEFKGTSDPAMICAIGRKVKIVPEAEDLDILVSLLPNATSNITKGFITNAIAELIYSGQLRLGDDITIREMLDYLGQEGDAVLIENVERVEALLDFLTGKTR
ncbi:MAG: hypothetical protein JNK89_11505 [Saprospiraceae bacterium]|nr:hypothetical protein [Saprospiraceae bacterium]